MGNVLDTVIGFGTMLFLSYFIGMFICGVCYFIVCNTCRIKIGNNEIIEDRTMFDRIGMKYHPTWQLILKLTIIGFVALNLYSYRTSIIQANEKEKVLSEIESEMIPGYRYIGIMQ